MTAKELSYVIGCHGLYQINGLEVEVSVVDTKYVYGCARLQITPIRGAGMVWVDAHSVVLDEVQRPSHKVNPLLPNPLDLL